MKYQKSIIPLSLTTEPEHECKCFECKQLAAILTPHCIVNYLNASFCIVATVLWHMHHELMTFILCTYIYCLMK